MSTIFRVLSRQELFAHKGLYVAGENTEPVTNGGRGIFCWWAHSRINASLKHPVDGRGAQVTITSSMLAPAVRRLTSGGVWGVLDEEFSRLGYTGASVDFEGFNADMEAVWSVSIDYRPFLTSM